jgi:hypothetical protein
VKYPSKDTTAILHEEIRKALAKRDKEWMTTSLRTYVEHTRNEARLFALREAQEIIADSDNVSSDGLNEAILRAEKLVNGY